jgi:hypothetical protein
MRFWPLLAIFFVLSWPAQSQSTASRAHLEGCLIWQNASEGYVAFNQCDSHIAVKFMMLDDRRVIEGEAPPHGRFTAATPLRGSLIFTACPVGYVPSVRFAADNAEQIAVSLYNCLPPGRPNS